MQKPYDAAYSADNIRRILPTRGNLLTIRSCLLASLLLISPAAVAQYAVTLAFPDGTIEVCSGTGFVLDYLALNIAVTECTFDRIFADGLGG